MSHYVGVDISKDNFHFCILTEDSKILSSGEFPMSSQGFSDFFNLLSTSPFTAFLLKKVFKPSYLIPRSSTDSFSLSLLTTTLNLKTLSFALFPALFKNLKMNLLKLKLKSNTALLYFSLKLKDSLISTLILFCLYCTNIPLLKLSKKLSLIGYLKLSKTLSAKVNQLLLHHRKSSRLLKTLSALITLTFLKLSSSTLTNSFSLSQE
jgi:hypothetical protein